MKGSVDTTKLLPAGLGFYGGLCGWALARAHARTGDAVAIAAYLGTSDRFDGAIADFAEAYADLNERDYRRTSRRSRRAGCQCRREAEGSGAALPTGGFPEGAVCSDGRRTLQPSEVSAWHSPAPPVRTRRPSGSGLGPSGTLGTCRASGRGWRGVTASTRGSGRVGSPRSFAPATCGLSDVAVKVLLANHVTDPVVAARFEREARVLAAVDHPNVVAVHDVEPGDPETGAEPFLVMDLCGGGSLADRLAASASGALPPDELVPLLVDVAAGLDALHARGIVHRDLKPSNVLLSGGRARIADLGIAAAGPSELTATGTTVGTLAYLAPEQLAGEPGSPASDVHGLGVIAFVGLTGRLPRPPEASPRSSPRASCRSTRLGPATRSRLSVRSAIALALAGDPSRRPTATELGATLAAALERWRAGRRRWRRGRRMTHRPARRCHSPELASRPGVAGAAGADGWSRSWPHWSSPSPRIGGHPAPRIRPFGGGASPSVAGGAPARVLGLRERGADR